jgi:hypothetical protein
VEILLKTAGLNFLFLKLELTFTFFLFIFLFSFPPRSCFEMRSKKVVSKDGSSSERVLILKQKKEISNPCRLFFCFKINTLFWT